VAKKQAKNPIVLTDIPDPCVIRVGGNFYMTSTTMYFTPGCPIMRSRDLVHWEIVNYVYETLDDSDHMTLSNGKHDYGCGTWASSLRMHCGIFYVSFVANNLGKTFIFQTEDIENGPWRKYVIDGIYHDMSLLFDDDGKVYMVYGAGEIKIIELNRDVTAIKPGGMNKTIIANADPTGGNALAEGSHIYKINHKYYIFIIAWPPSGTGRRIQVCYRSDNIDGPYERRIVLDDNMGFRNDGVAQGGIVDTFDGRWYAFLFQDHGAVGRVPVLVPINWVKDWPVFGINGKVPTEFPLPGTYRETAPLVISDNFNNTKLTLQWQWNHNPDNDYWSLTARPGWLRLTTSHVVSNITEARNTLTQRTINDTCAGMVKIDTRKMKNGDVAGLVALQEKYGFVGVEMKDDKKHIIVKTPEGIREAVPLTQHVIYLKIDFDFRNARDIAQFYFSKSGRSLYKIGDNLHMVYSLAHFTGYRFGLFNYATKTTGGYVDFDWFRLS